MNKNHRKNSERPERIVQLYDAEKQKQFAHFSAMDRLEWLSAINELYNQVHAKRVNEHP